MTHIAPSRMMAAAHASASGSATASAHLAVPRRGHVLTTVAERHGGPLRQAAQHLAAFLAEHDAARQQGAFLVQPDARKSSFGLQRPLAPTAAWSVVAAWAVAVALRAISPRASLREAEDWFGTAGTAASVCGLIPEEAQRHANALLGGSDSDALAQLLPYVLDPHGPGSRLSVRRQPETRDARARKRAEGVFYTPADVADYMACLALPNAPRTRVPAVLDPACGTGVFLRAALNRLAVVFPDASRTELALASLHGVDVDPTALNGAAFVLLHDCAPHAPGGKPISVWRALRRNLLWADALTLDPREDATGRARRQVGGAPPRLSLAAHLPALAGGADVILGNPPYADVGERDDFAVLASVFETVAAAPTPKADLYPVFVEQMVRLSAPSASGSLVLPLSIACNSRQQFVALRRLVARTPGTWRFAFFDRQPHALFGEDVKTRNAVVAWNREPGDADARVFTGPLRKWRAQARVEMLTRISFTRLSVPILAGIPKVSGQVQAEALASMSQRALRLSGVVQAFGRRAPMGARRPTVFVGATAYNFLNVFREVALAAPDGLAPTSHHPHALDCASERDANAVLAVLASGTAFWWWHAHDDGFHVSRSTLEEFPVGIDVLAGSEGDRLAEIGARIWASAKRGAVVSNNGGKASFAFPPSCYAAGRAAADRILRQALSLSPAFDAELEHFLHDVTSAGGGARALEQGETDA